MLSGLIWKAIEAADRRGLMPCPSRPAVIASTDFGPRALVPIGNLGTLRSGLLIAAVAKRLVEFLGRRPDTETRGLCSTGPAGCDGRADARVRSESDRLTSQHFSSFLHDLDDLEALCPAHRDAADGQAGFQPGRLPAEGTTLPPCVHAACHDVGRGPGQVDGFRRCADLPCYPLGLAREVMRRHAVKAQEHARITRDRHESEVRSLVRISAAPAWERVRPAMAAQPLLVLFDLRVSVSAAGEIYFTRRFARTESMTDCLRLSVLI